MVARGVSNRVLRDHPLRALERRAHEPPQGRARRLPQPEPRRVMRPRFVAPIAVRHAAFPLARWEPPAHEAALHSRLGRGRGKGTNSLRISLDWMRGSSRKAVMGSSGRARIN
jgi:hypothetical protein